MTELQMIRRLRPDAALPSAGELAVARDRLTAAIAATHTGGSVPAAPAREDPRRNSRRRVSLLAMAVSGTAVAAAAAVLVVTAGAGRIQGRAHGGAPTVTTAYVLSRAERALTSAAQGHLIEEANVVGHGMQFNMGPGKGRAVVAPREAIWWYFGQNRIEGLTSAGKRVFDSKITYSYQPKRATLNSVMVDYAARTWWHWRQYSLGVSIGPIWTQPRSCAAVTLPSPAGSPGSNWAAQIHRALLCGTYRVAGTGQIGGVDVIKIVPKPQRLPPRGLQVISQAMWVSRATYLPVRVQWTWLIGRRSHGSLTGDFAWLAPTTANLASLNLTIPGGFRQIPWHGIAEPGSVLTPRPRIPIVAQGVSSFP